MCNKISDQDIEHILNTKFTLEVGADYDPKVLQILLNFKVKDSDIFLMGHPKTGTTWAQEMIWLIANDLNLKGAEKFIDERFPVLELFAFDVCKSNPDIEKHTYHTDSIKVIENQRDQRFVKTHMRWSYLPKEIQDGTKKPKIIYICRNAKDTCVSFYSYMKNILKIYSGTLEEFCEVFLAGRVGSGCYWNHVLQFWNKSRTESNILFLKYEDMKANLSEVMRQVASFLDKSLDAEQVTTLIKRLDFDSMKNNPAVNHDDLYKKSGFMRVGKVGDFKNKMSTDMIRRFDVWTEECLAGSGLENYYCNN